MEKARIGRDSLKTALQNAFVGYGAGRVTRENIMGEVAEQLGVSRFDAEKSLASQASNKQNPPIQREIFKAFKGGVVFTEFQQGTGGAKGPKKLDESAWEAERDAILALVNATPEVAAE